MKLPKLLKKPIAKLKRAVGRTPTQTKNRSFTVSSRYIKKDSNTMLGKVSDIEKKGWQIDDRVSDSKFSDTAKLRARARLKRLTRKKLDKAYIDSAPTHRQNRLTKHQELRQKKNKREDRLLSEITAFSNAQKPIDFGSKKQYDKWQALRKAKKVSK